MNSRDCSWSNHLPHLRIFATSSMKVSTFRTAFCTRPHVTTRECSMYRMTAGQLTAPSH